MIPAQSVLQQIHHALKKNIIIVNYIPFKYHLTIIQQEGLSFLSQYFNQTSYHYI